MKFGPHTLVIMTIAAALIGCDKNSGDSSSSGATAASTITLQVASSTLAPGDSTTVTVTGGSGTYSSAYASQGTIYQQSNNVYVYTAPTSPTASSSTLTIYDSSGAVGTGYLFISGSNATSDSSCGGSYSATIGGVSANLYVVQGSGGYIGGYLYMANYYYPLVGSCSLASGSGSLSFTNVVDGSTYSGSISLTGTQLSISGTMTSADASTFSWSATSQTAAVTFTAPTYSCQGNYDATIATNTGSVTLVQDGSGNVAGYLYLQGYVYALTGTCNANGGSVTLTNHTTGSKYTGMATYNGSKVNMSGSFTTTSGSVYTWSAAQK